MNRTAFTPIVLVVLLGLNGCASVSGRFANSQPRPRSSQPKFAIARMQERQGKLRQAGQIYSQLVKEDPENAELHHRLGVVAAKQGRPAVAQERLKQARKLSPHDPEILADLGYLLYVQGEQKESEATLREALDVAPQHKRAMNNLGMLLAEQGKDSEAFSLFQRSKGSAEAHTNLAFIHAKQGHLKAAKKHFNKALDIDHQLRPAAQGLMQLAEMQRSAETAHGKNPKNPLPQYIESISDGPADRTKTAQKKTWKSSPQLNPFDPSHQDLPKNPVQAAMALQKGAESQATATNDESSQSDGLSANRTEAAATAEKGSASEVTQTDFLKAAKPKKMTENSEAQPMPAKTTPTTQSEAGPQNPPHQQPESFESLCSDANGTVRSLLTVLEFGNAAAKQQAIGDLAALGEEAHCALPALRTISRQTDGRVKVAAAWAIWQIADKTDYPTAVLLNCLSDHEEETKKAAVNVLRQLAEKEPAVRDLLVQEYSRLDRSARARLQPFLAEMQKSPENFFSASEKQDDQPGNLPPAPSQ